MHRLFEQVLEKKDLSKAGDLFSLEDSVIVDELSEVLKTIQVTKNIYISCSVSSADGELIGLCLGNLQQAGVSDQSQQPVFSRDLRDQSDLRHPGDGLHPETC